MIRNKNPTQHATILKRQRNQYTRYYLPGDTLHAMVEAHVSDNFERGHSGDNSQRHTVDRRRLQGGAITAVP